MTDDQAATAIDAWLFRHDAELEDDATKEEAERERDCLAAFALLPAEEQARYERMARDDLARWREEHPAW